MNTRSRATDRETSSVEPRPRDRAELVSAASRALAARACTARDGAGATPDADPGRARHAGEADPVRRVPPATGRRGTGWVLVVDDDAQVRAVLRRMLATGGYDAVDAPSLDRAVADYGELDVKVLIYDLLLPNHEMTSGFSEARDLFPGAKLVAISGGGRCGPEPLLTVAKKLGAAATLAKPFSWQHLLAVVGELWPE